MTQADGKSGSSTDAAGVTRETVQAELQACLEDLHSAAHLGPGKVLVVGASSSEVLGQRIGTFTSLEVGESVVRTVLAFTRETGCDVAFQCCEHLNRALVVERDVAATRQWQQVTAVPVPGAGGAVAAHAYFALDDACLVESLQADAGIDIGDTLIGMHLKRVVVPIRGRRNTVGAAHVTMATTRPPLIGGQRAVYTREEAMQRVHAGD